MNSMNSGYQLRRVSGPDIEPVTLALARAQCNIDADITETDTLITLWIRAARELAESFTKQTFCESTWLLSLNSFPADCHASPCIELPNGPVLGINSFTYLNSDGVRTPFAAGEWQEALGDTPPWVAPAYGEFWPYPRASAGAVQIEYRAGYAGVGSPGDASGVPACVAQAILFLVAFWYANRETVNVGNITSELPFGFYDLLQPLRVYP